ncbi:MAG TPA: hypothetical protein VMF65_15920, partial [Acidimicrobiales bacterium]|nr:hypothetical protein [Acidimicrobiales bacterium]
GTVPPRASPLTSPSANGGLFPTNSSFYGSPGSVIGSGNGLDDQGRLALSDKAGPGGTGPTSTAALRVLAPQGMSPQGTAARETATAGPAGSVGNPTPGPYSPRRSSTLQGEFRPVAHSEHRSPLSGIPTEQHLPAPPPDALSSKMADRYEPVGAVGSTEGIRSPDARPPQLGPDYAPRTQAFPAHAFPVPGMRLPAQDDRRAVAAAEFSLSQPPPAQPLPGSPPNQRGGPRARAGNENQASPSWPAPGPARVSIGTIEVNVVAPSPPPAPPPFALAPAPRTARSDVPSVVEVTRRGTGRWFGTGQG